MELALCAAIVARHGGRVWARPEGEGVRYGIFLMRTVMDEVRYETGHAEGTELILVKKR